MLNKKIYMKNIFILVFILFCFNLLLAQDNSKKIIAGAERLNVYLPLIKDKSVGIFANQTSVVGNSHLVDTLLKRGVNVKVIFGPEHGFRGSADAGEKVGNYVDEKTGIPVISLYGPKRRPSAEDLKDIDILIFDIQDVGVRFYTFISSLQEFMEAAFENSKPLLLLDRPNPNGHYVDGPVLEPMYKSFVGMQPVPIVYGMTLAEYAFMIAGEKWLTEKANEKYSYYQTTNISADTLFHFQVIKCKNYSHSSLYELPIKPSPNLPTIQSIYSYPSTCFFEGTVLSEGRGTDYPFQIFGHPSLPNNLFSFTPTSRDGAKTPKLLNKECFGWNITGTKEEVYNKINRKIQLHWLIEAFKLFPDKENFFIKPKKENAQAQDYFFNKLAGNGTLMNQIKQSLPEDDIRKSWEPGLTQFKEIRKKYLLYEDF